MASEVLLNAKSPDLAAQRLKLALEFVALLRRRRLIGEFHGCGGLTSQKLVLPVVQRWSAHAELVGYSLGPFLGRAKLHDSRLHPLPGMPSSTHSVNDGPSGLRKGLAILPGGRPNASLRDALRPGAGALRGIIEDLLALLKRGRRARDLPVSLWRDSSHSRLFRERKSLHAVRRSVLHLRSDHGFSR